MTAGFWTTVLAVLAAIAVRVVLGAALGFVAFRFFQRPLKWVAKKTMRKALEIAEDALEDRSAKNERHVFQGGACACRMLSDGPTGIRVDRTICPVHQGVCPGTVRLVQKVPCGRPAGHADDWPCLPRFALDPATQAPRPDLEDLELDLLEEARP